MALSLSACASRAFRSLFVAAGVIALVGCSPDGQPSLNAAQPRGATVAFESIEGPPPAQFRTLVSNLNEEAQARRLAVTSRDSQSAYRVRGYLAAETAKGKTRISWVWDIFDGDQQRALRISGEETVNGRHHDAWALADDAMLHRIARSTMDQLAIFLTSPEVAPSAPAAAPGIAAIVPANVALIGDRDPSPEASGIFRIFKPQVDPLTETNGAAPQADAAVISVPLPRPRPTKAPSSPILSERETFTLAASSW